MKKRVEYTRYSSGNGRLLLIGNRLIVEDIV